MNRRVCVIGPGAIGGTVAAVLCAAGERVSLVGRPGAHLDALRADGIRLQRVTPGDAGTAASTENHEQRCHPAEVVDDADLVEDPELVVTCVKAQDLPSLAPLLGRLERRGAVVCVIVNGIPWWLTSTLTGAAAHAVLGNVDPGGRVLRQLPADRVVAGVAHLSASVSQPGLIRWSAGDELLLGVPVGDQGRAWQLAEVLGPAGLRAEVVADVRTQVWAKLLGNMNLNPVTALTGATVDRVLDDRLVRGLCTSMLDEAIQVGKAVGIDAGIDAEARMAVAARLGAFRTSMLQDADRGRPLELAAVTAAVTELGALVGVACPHTESVLGLVRLWQRSRG